MDEHGLFTPIGDLGNPKGKAAVIWARDEEGRHLFQIRDNYSYVKMGGYLCLFGGHHEDDETLRSCAAREFAEETGIAIPEKDFLPRVVCLSPSNDQMLHYFFELTRRIHTTDIVVHEGAGFVFLEDGQFDDFPMIPAIKMAMPHLIGA